MLYKKEIAFDTKRVLNEFVELSKFLKKERTEMLRYSGPQGYESFMTRFSLSRQTGQSTAIKELYSENKSVIVITNNKSMLHDFCKSLGISFHCVMNRRQSYDRLFSISQTRDIKNYIVNNKNVIVIFDEIEKSKITSLCNELYPYYDGIDAIVSVGSM